MSSQRFKTIRILILLVVGVVGLLILMPWSGVLRKPQKFQLNFIPKSYDSCEQLIPNISMTQRFNERVPDFMKNVGNFTRLGIREGFSGQNRAQYLTMHYLAGQSHVKTVCETGFNYGHSSFNYLTANDKVVVHSFDLARHQYARVMAKYLTEKFPGRLFVHFGNSVQTIPEFIKQNPGFKCDYMFVDGGHIYSVALADLKNFAQIANLDDNIILFDDYPTHWGKGFGKAWDDVVKAGIIKEEMRCTSKQRMQTQRGFTLGRVVKTQ